MIVYLLLYQIKGTKITDEFTSSTSWAIQSPVITGKDTKISDLLLETDWSGTTDIQSGKTLNTTVSLFGNISSETGSTQTWTVDKDKSASIKLLSGTKIRYWVIDSVEKLGISYQYALKDNQDIYYAYLGKNNTINLESIVKKAWGTLYSILRENEIIKNNLFGEKVVYINLPEYKQKKVILLVTVDWADWLIQIDYAKYYTSKWYLKTLFIQ